MNSTDPDQRTQNAAFNQGLHCSLTQGSSKTSINLILWAMIRLHMLCLLLACNIKIIFLTTLIEFVMKCIKIKMILKFKFVPFNKYLADAHSDQYSMHTSRNFWHTILI